MIFYDKGFLLVLINCNAKFRYGFQVGCIQITVICTNFTDLTGQAAQAFSEAVALSYQKRTCYGRDNKL